MMDRSTAFEYDETEIAARLTALPSAARALFACACAERLMPAYRWFCQMTDSTNFELVRGALDAAWSADIADKAMKAGDVTALMPHDDDEGAFPGSAVAQNAVACVAYALEVCQKDDVQASVWAARQLYEAADAIVQQGSAIQTYVENIDQEAPVQLVLRGIYTLLDYVDSLDTTNLVAKAREDGEAFLGFMNGKVWLGANDS